MKIEGLIAHLKTITCNTFVLISTVDVFKDPIGADEDKAIDESGLHAYGFHRRLLEKFVESHFPHYLIVRLPGLIGPGLRKNIIFDLLNENELSAIDSRGIFQFYPMANLWRDIKISLNAGLKLVHLTAEPISVSDISAQCFGRSFNQVCTNKPIFYDLRTKYAKIFGTSGCYQYSRSETIHAVRAYAQTESRTSKYILAKI
jgi:dTDP-4-dehydrorhamnose reductase